MLTRSQSKPFLSDHSDPSIDIATSTSKTDTETCKNICDVNLKPRSCQENSLINQNVIQEEEFELLMNAFEKVSRFCQPPSLVMANISKQLRQFTLPQLLLKSESNLWVKKTQSQHLKQYCTTMVSLNEKNLTCTVLRKDRQAFIAVQGTDINPHFRLFEAEPLALQLFEKRQMFFQQFNKKFQLENQDSKLTQLSNEIIYLYRQYVRLRRLIMNRKFKEQQKYTNKNPNSKMSIILKQLRQLRKRLKRK